MAVKRFLFLSHFCHTFADRLLNKMSLVWIQLICGIGFMTIHFSKMSIILTGYLFVTYFAKSRFVDLPNRFAVLYRIRIRYFAVLLCTAWLTGGLVLVWFARPTLRAANADHQTPTSD